ncbi:MAG: iron ABC transporter permease, partial [Pigmentiphaga sp.]|nr:iron ABC transporter permease [Pigmentiphaga sp.]
MPLGFLVWQSFLTPDSAEAAARYTLGNYATAYGSAETLRLLGNSLVFAGGTAAFAFLVGGSLAWMNERTNTPFKRLFFALSIVPLIIPGIMFTISWILLGSPKIGLLNLLLQRWFGTEYVFLNVYSMWGMIWVEGLHYSPMAFLMMTAASRSMDPSLEESAMMSGASIFQIFWRITLKLTWPAIFASLLILFVRAIEAFEVPALLGIPVGIHVFTSAIYQAVHQYPSQVGLASAYGTTLLLITTGGIYLQSRLTGRGSRYATVTGKGFRPRVVDLGPWRYVTAGIFIVYFLLIVLLPFLVLLWSSLQRYYSVPSMEALGQVGLDAYRFLWSHPTIIDSVWNSLLLAFASATIVMLLTSVVCWIVVKTRLPGRWLLDNIASLPLVFPGLVLGLAVMVFYLNFNIGIYGTLWIMLVVYVTRFMPYGMRYNSTSMLQ